VRVFDKMDGSLGILYPTSQGMAVATRGSFTSEQALKATEILHEKYPEWAQITYDWFRSNFDANWYEVNYTDLVEIVYPENRIVVDYARSSRVYTPFRRSWSPSLVRVRRGTWYGLRTCRAA
jgi:RNA ligase